MSVHRRYFLNVPQISDDEETQQVNDRATLVLASVAKKVQHSRSKWASSVVQRLEKRIAVHGTEYLQKQGHAVEHVNTKLQYAMINQRMLKYL